jgi:hypothetical protein
VADLDGEIDRIHQALSVTPLDSPDRATMLDTVAHLFVIRFERAGRLEDLDAAIAAINEVLSLLLPDSSYRAIKLDSLGDWLLTRFEHGGRLEDLDAAIAAANEAFLLTPMDSPDRSMKSDKHQRRILISIRREYPCALSGVPFFDIEPGGRASGTNTYRGGLSY